MIDEFQKRALDSIRARHMTAIRRLAENLQANAGYAIGRLDRGAIPHMGSILCDAQDMDERIKALEAMTEVSAIYEMGGESK